VTKFDVDSSLVGINDYFNKASTAWDFSPDLGISGTNLGFREFSKQLWDFYGNRKLKKYL